MEEKVRRTSSPAPAGKPPGKIIDAVPPSNIDAEKAVLGSMILDAAAIDSVRAIVTKQHFFNSRHQLIFEALCELHEKRTVIDFTTVIDELRRRRVLEEVGGPPYILSLEQHVFSTANASHHAHIIRQKHQLRELIRITDDIKQEAFTERDGASELINRAQQLIFKLSEDGADRDFRDIGSLTLETVDEIDRRCSASHEVHGVATGYAQLDEWTGGFQKSDLLILAARPSMGKTAFGLNIALNVGAGLRNRRLGAAEPQGVGIFSLEMSAAQINQRLLSTIAEVPMHLMRSGKMNASDRQKLHHCAKQLFSMPIFIDDTPGIGIMEMRAKARRLAVTCPNLSLLIIDYLQLMRGSDRPENRQQEIAEITRSLKGLARELQVPILALSQLSRLIEQRKGKNAKPMLSDLRESGAIEQDADVVMFIHRERSYDRRDAENEEKSKARITTEKAELIIGKQRNGPVGTIDLVFFNETATFHNLARPVDEDGPGF